MKLSFFLVILFNLVFTGIVEDINANPLSTWKAQEYPREIINPEKLRSRLIHPWTAHTKSSAEPIAKDTPESFDARDQWPGLIVSVYDQGECGASYAFAVVETMSDRVSINNSAATVLSVEDIISCDPNSFGCSGGYVDEAWKYVLNTGLALDSCIPYTGGIASCKTCVDGTDIIRIKAKSVYSVESVQNMQTELQSYGPFEVTFDVYEDFLYYTSGVYQHVYGGLEGGHVAVVVGWGVSDNIPYWIVQNNWGPDWGIGGYFWILRGKNECGIEQDGVAALV